MKKPKIAQMVLRMIENKVSATRIVEFFTRNGLAEESDVLLTISTVASKIKEQQEFQIKRLNDEIQRHQDYCRILENIQNW